jgi:hypothetical protein
MRGERELEEFDLPMVSSRQNLIPFCSAADS